MELKSSKSSGKVSNALAICQSEFGVFETNRDGYNYKYLDLAGILKIVLPIMGKNNLAIIQANNLKIIGEVPYVEVLTRLQCEDEYIEFSIDFPMIEATKKTDTDIMMLGSTISYLRRYAIQSILGIASSSDKDVEQMQKEIIDTNSIKLK